jgi:hypothetical protein
MAAFPQRANNGCGKFAHALMIQTTDSDRVPSYPLHPPYMSVRHLWEALPHF